MQVAEVLDERSCGRVGKDVVDARRVGAFGHTVPILNSSIRVHVVVWGAFRDVGPPMLKHVKEVRVVIDVGICVHTDEVRCSTDPGSRAVRQAENVSAVTARTAIDTGNVKARRAKIVTSPSALALGAEGLEDLVPALGGLESGDAWRGIVAGGVDDSVLRQDGDPP